MELRTVATFLRVAELQSFSRAAEQLGYSQAAVTVQVKQLEQELGAPLFERIGRRIQLTEEGTRFIPAAMELLKAAHKAKALVHADGSPAGRLRIGTAESLLMSVLTPLMPEFHRLCPGVETAVYTGRISELFGMVRQNDVDVLFFLDKKTDFPEWVKVLERPEPIVFVAQASHPLARQRGIALETLTEQPLILTEKGVSYRYDLEQLLAARGLELHPFFETGNTDVIVRMLLSHGGVSFLPRYVVEAEVAAGRLAILDVDCPPAQMWSQLVYHRNKWVTPQMEIFLDLMGRRIGPES